MALGTCYRQMNTTECCAACSSSLHSSVEAAVSGITRQVQMLRDPSVDDVVCKDAI